MTPNLKAFLDMIAASEIGYDLLALSDNGYNIIVGSTPKNPILFPALPDGKPDYSRHPHKFMQINAHLRSSAAGRYQILAHWAEAYTKFLGLKDYGPASQDAITVQMIKECRALQMIEYGALKDAIHACIHLYASFPGNTAGQNQRSPGFLEQAFIKAGGTLQP